MGDHSLIDLNAISKPAVALLDKISKAVGGVFKPFQIVRIAKAEAEAEVIRAKSNIQVTELQRRAVQRFLKEEAKKQSNMERITERAILALEDSSLPERVDDDWISNFFDKCRNVSDEDMQRLWSRVLAAQANSPRSFSRQTVNLIADLEKEDAELFTQLCGFSWEIGGVTPLVFDVDDEIYRRNGLNFGVIVHLQSLGLLQFDHLGGFRQVQLPKEVEVSYFGRAVKLTLLSERNNELEIGQILLTRAGGELARVCGAKPVDGFFSKVYDGWAARSFVPKESIASPEKVST